MLKNCPRTIMDWLTIIILIGTISGACFAGTSKILAIILKDQFDAIDNRIASIETNMKVIDERTKTTNDMIYRVWYKVK